MKTTLSAAGPLGFGESAVLRGWSRRERRLVRTVPSVDPPPSPRAPLTAWGRSVATRPALPCARRVKIAKIACYQDIRCATQHSLQLTNSHDRQILSEGQVHFRTDDSTFGNHVEEPAPAGQRLFPQKAVSNPSRGRRDPRGQTNQNLVREPFVCFPTSAAALRRQPRPGPSTRFPSRAPCVLCCISASHGGTDVQGTYRR